MESTSEVTRTINIEDLTDANAERLISATITSHGVCELQLLGGKMCQINFPCHPCPPQDAHQLTPSRSIQEDMEHGRLLCSRGLQLSSERRQHFESFSQIERSLVKAIQAKALSYYVEQLLKEAKKKRNEEPVKFANNLLGTALMFSHYEYGIFDMIAKEFPDLLKQEDSEYGTILHLAVARQDIAGAKVVMEQWKEAGENLMELINKPINKEFEEKWMARHCQAMKLPLLMAAWNHDIEMVKELVANGASWNQVNAMEQNVFHCFVLGAVNKSNLQETFRMFMESAKDFTEKLLYSQDKNGYTALTLSVEHGSSEVFELIMNCDVYKQLDVEDRTSDDIFMYDVTEIDSRMSYKTLSAMELINARRGRHPEKYYEFVKIWPILNLIKCKWPTYQRWFWIWLACHLLIMISYTTAVLFDIGYYMLLFDAILLTYSLLILIPGGYRLVHCRYLYNTWKTLKPLSHKHLMVLILFSTIAAIVLQIFCKECTTIVRSLNLVSGWMYTTSFTRGFKLTSTFTVMLATGLKDIIKFGLIFAVSLVASAAAMTILFNVPTEKSEQFRDFPTSFFTMFSLSIGIIDIESFQKSHYPPFAQFLYMLFLGVAYILLLNMIIALLSNTCSQVSSNEDSLWYRLNKLSIILDLSHTLHTYQLSRDNRKKIYTYYCEVKAPTLKRVHVRCANRSFKDAFREKQELLKNGSADRGSVTRRCRESRVGHGCVP